MIVGLLQHMTLNRILAMESGNFFHGKNPATEVDAQSLPSQMAEDYGILENLLNNAAAPVDALVYISFMFSGTPSQISEMQQYLRGMTFATVSHSQWDVASIVVTGNLDQWQKCVLECCKDYYQGFIRDAFNQVYTVLCHNGFSHLFYGYRTKDHRDRTFLLEKK